MSDLMKTAIDALLAESSIYNKIAKDKNNAYSIRPGETIVSGMLVPAITVCQEEGESEPKFPTSHDTLRVIIWINDKTTREYYKYLREFSDLVIALFNRKGSTFNSISGTTGNRYCRFLKRGVTIDFDTEVKLFYAEIVFDVIRSEGETFSPSDSGDLAWV